MSDLNVTIDLLQELADVAYALDDAAEPEIVLAKCRHPAELWILAGMLGNRGNVRVAKLAVAIAKKQWDAVIEDWWRTHHPEVLPLRRFDDVIAALRGLCGFSDGRGDPA
jgi:hypothetical protein